MNSAHYYSVRMHASSGSVHVSGAERLVAGDYVKDAVAEVCSRAFSKQIDPERVSISVDDLGRIVPRMLTALDLAPLRIENVDQGRQAALSILRVSGVSDRASHRAIDLLSEGPAGNGGTMRGAMILDWVTGDRLEPDRDRGVRATRFDWSEDASRRLQKVLQERGLGHFRTREALALASKIVCGPGVRAELCWSDDPDYCAGYVASLKTGYARIPLLKHAGIDRGGRAIFIDRDAGKVEELIAYLETEPVLLAMPQIVRRETDAEEFLRELR